MTLKSYLWGIRISALMALVTWIIVIFNIDPEKSGLIGQALFFISAFLFFAGIAILFFTRIRRLATGNDECALSHLGISFRQGVLAALLIIGFLFLQQLRILTWWDGALLAAGILLVELYFLTRR